jgi:hypothetical protein
LPRAISQRSGFGDVMWPAFAGGKSQGNVRAIEEERTYLAYHA